MQIGMNKFENITIFVLLLAIYGAAEHISFITLETCFPTHVSRIKLFCKTNCRLSNEYRKYISWFYSTVFSTTATTTIHFVAMIHYFVILLRLFSH